MPGSLVRLECATKTFRGVRALDCASLEARPGEVTVVAGPSGSGKTTLLRVVGGFEEPDSGRVFFDEKEVTGLPPWERRAVILTQRPVLLPHLSVEENIVLAAISAGLGRAEAKSEARRLAGLLGVLNVLGRRPGELSGGQLQRASLAALLASRPRVLLLDEPFAHLDLPLRERLRRLVVGLARSEGITIIKVTHDQDEALEVADRLAILIGGRILDEGPAERIYLRPRDPRAAVFMGHNLVCREDGIVTFPMEAVTLGGGWARGVVEEVLRRRGYSIVAVRTSLGSIRLVVAGRRLETGVSVGLGLDEGLVSEWGSEWSGLCAGGLSGVVPPG